MNIEERDRAITSRIEESRGLTNDHKGLAAIVRHAANRMAIAQRVTKEWAQRAALNPSDTIAWGSSAVEQEFELLFWMQTLNIICAAEDNAQRFGELKIELDGLRDSLLRGHYEDKSTSALARGVGEARTSAARIVLRSFNELVRAVEKQGW